MSRDDLAPAESRRPSRRRFLSTSGLIAAATATAATGGCDVFTPAPEPTPPPDPLTGLLTDTAKLADRYDSAIAAFPELRPRLAPIARTHRAHVDDLARLTGTTPPTPAGSPGTSPASPSGPTTALPSGSDSPTALPSDSPTGSPTALPAGSPTALPADSPTALPSSSPTALPSGSGSPSGSPGGLASGPAGGAPGGTPGGPPGVGDADAERARLRLLETQARDAARRACLAAPVDRAALLGTITAARATHVEALR